MSRGPKRPKPLDNPYISLECNSFLVSICLFLLTLSRGPKCYVGLKAFRVQPGSAIVRGLRRWVKGSFVCTL